MCIVTALGVLTCCLFIVFMKWLFWSLRMHQIEWDMSTITAEDYTIEMPIALHEYKTWKGVEWGTLCGKEKSYKEMNKAPAYVLKRYLKKEIETRLTADLIEKRKSGESFGKVRPGKKPMQKVRIADIQFSYNNSNVINKLMARGAALRTNGNSTGCYESCCTKIGNCISAIWRCICCKKKPAPGTDLTDDIRDNFEQYRTPTSAFITFEEEDGRILAL
jgi:hypothetical protein